jgi:hypothetical protein
MWYNSNILETELTDSTIFEGQTSPQPAAPQTTEQQTSVLTALVGETQKYKTSEDLAKAYANADQFIEQLKEENRQLREKANSAKTIDEVLERISEASKPPQADTPVAPTQKVEDVQAIVKSALERERTEGTRIGNIKAADAALKAKFGDKAQEVFNSLASTDTIRNSLMEIAAVSPDKFVALFGALPVPTGNSIDSGSTSSFVTSNGSNRAGVEGTKEWAAKMRKDNPSEYWSSEFQSKLQRVVAKNPQLYFG